MEQGFTKGHQEKHLLKEISAFTLFYKKKEKEGEHMCEQAEWTRSMNSTTIKKKSLKTFHYFIIATAEPANDTAVAIIYIIKIIP